MSTDATAHGPLALVSALERDGGYHAWAQALALAEVVDAERRRNGDAAARRVLDEAVARSRLDPTTVRGRVKCIGFLRDRGLIGVAEARILPIGIAAKITNDKHATDREKADLVEEFHDVLVADPDRRGVRAEVGRRLQMLHAAKSKDTDWQRSTDLWNSPSFDPRFGQTGNRDRYPGQAVQILLDRFLPGGGSFLSAYTDDGTALDVAVVTPKVGRYFGFDLRVDPHVAERHADHVIEFDGTQPDWTPVCPAGADLVLVTAPTFSFVKSGRTDLPTDLGNITDIDEWLGAMSCVVRGAAGVLVSGGVCAVAIKNTADFGGKGPVPNLVHRVTAMVEELVGDNFLGHAIVTTGARKRGSHHAGEWLVPEVLHVVVYRGA